MSRECEHGYEFELCRAEMDEGRAAEVDRAFQEAYDYARSLSDTTVFPTHDSAESYATFVAQRVARDGYEFSHSPAVVWEWKERTEAA